jgi:hypothetical protein
MAGEFRPDDQQWAAITSRTLHTPPSSLIENSRSHRVPLLAVAELAPEKGQQVGVDLILVGGRQAVRSAGIVLFLGTPDEPG